MGLKTFDDELHVTLRTNVDKAGEIVDEDRIGKVLFWDANDQTGILFGVKWLFINQTPAVEFYPVTELTSLSEDLTDELVYGLDDTDDETDEEENVDNEEPLNLRDVPPRTTLHT